MIPLLEVCSPVTRVFRAWYAKLAGGLPPEQHDIVDKWDNSEAGRYLRDVIHSALTKSWCEVPTTFFGDSASFYISRKKNTPSPTT